ncbi:MAG: protein-L-isoaspartate(D-aspartate) O-methyltransferase [Bacteroidota bacterium]
MRYARRLARLLDLLRAKGLTDERVLAALGRVPRHEFVEDGLRFRAYDDAALPIGLNQTISQPFTVATQTHLLDLGPHDRVLEIGTGSGYQAAVLCEMGAQVFSIERHAPLLARTNDVLQRLGYRLMTRAGDGTAGWPSLAPFDAILVTAGGRAVPQALLDQLRVPSDGSDGSKVRRGGRLVIPVGDTESQTMLRFTRLDAGTGEASFRREAFDEFRFVPLVREG